ncbi:Breast cancer anti-estrogen resistance protein 3-like protein [Leptotrombidium deliense]|uniref:Breast cancer anti-estrogen resistance protein 3-like protein n=1 Tax=Leptotrombidium deliense TaxID=299467 RepID=A0A443SUA9_9ACAR|nr:Breast cancer anti-estrogen resistance protein 3-like protein [Leptotrombidium deliense]
MAAFDAIKEEYRKELSAELALDSSDLRSHAWYHGTIPRVRAEQLVLKDGDFLIRDCSSRPGDYVLSCRFAGAPLHFVINKVVLQPYTVYERIQYTFEEDSFDTVPDLVTFYVGNRRPISAASGAVISRPINRTMPLTFYAAKYFSKSECTPAVKVNRDTSSPKSPSLYRYQGLITCDRPASRSSIGSINEEPPPKPHRDSRIRFFPSLSKTEPIYINCNDTTEDSTDSAFVSDSSRKNSGEKKCSRENSLHNIPVHAVPLLHPSSCINPQNYFTFLLTKDNKPLEVAAVNKMRKVLLETGARILANHITKCDLDFIKHLDKQSDFGLGVKSGLELLTLPQGSAYREDVLDRAECFKYFVALTLLVCQEENERVLVLDKWIQIAVEIKTALGNLMAFHNIMAALALPQITRLHQTWLNLRQKFTKNAVTYESKLRPTLKAMIECNEPLAPNTTFPHILTLVRIIRQHYAFMDEINLETNQEQILEKYKSFTFGFPWETTSSDFGLQQLFSHLESGRQIVVQCNLFKRNSEIVLDSIFFEELLLDMFTTEFHRRFLWGFRGSVAESCERYSKFEQVLTLLSVKCESIESSLFCAIII